MWFKRKAKNKRNERESLLEVKRRAGRAGTSARLRLVTALIAAVGGTMLGALVLWQAYRWALETLVYRNQAYAIRQIDLRHTGRLRHDQIRRWANVCVGQNLLALDLGRVRRDLESNPWIERADVETLRPDGLRLTVREREPVAQIIVWRLSRTESKAWTETNYVDAAGFVMPPLRAEWVQPGVDANFNHLTRLVGLEETDVVTGQPLRIPTLQPALALIRTYEDSTMYSLVDLDQLDLSARDALHGQLRQGTRVVFGLSQFDRQILRWRSIHDYAFSQNRSLAWIDLSVTNNIPARWMDSTNAPTTLRPAKPTRTPRRHV